MLTFGVFKKLRIRFYLTTKTNDHWFRTGRIEGAIHLGFVSDDNFVLHGLTQVGNLEVDFVSFVNFHESFSGPRGRTPGMGSANDHLRLSFTASVFGLRGVCGCGFATRGLRVEGEGERESRRKGVESDRG